MLNVDVDNLLEGNITYLEKSWQGYLILEENEDIFSGSEAYGKPLVYFFLSYFMLAGIGEIYILLRPLNLNTGIAEYTAAFCDQRACGLSGGSSEVYA